MAWEVVQVISGKNQIQGMMNGDVVEVPNFLGKNDMPSNITVGKKSYEVLSHIIDERDNILKISLAMASTKKEKSDDKPIKKSD
tara:strand:- start:429 stop:680 length:252 start_codon:yes stop_codon:yes gene_type:complete